MKPKQKIAAVALSILLILMGFQNCAQENAFQSAAINSLEMQSIEPDILPPPEEHKKTEVVTTYETILADRYYLKSLFEDVFGTTAGTKDSTRLFLNAMDFGSPCSVHESYFKAGRALVNTMENCGPSSTNRIAASLTPKTTVIRQALVTRACSDLTKDAVTLAFALKKIEPAGGAPKVTSANLLAAYRLFYRGKPDPHQGLIDSLAIIANSNGGPSLQSWGSTLFTVCASGHWQTL